MSQSKRIVVLGSGLAGVTAAHGSRRNPGDRHDEAAATIESEDQTVTTGSGDESARGG